MSVELIRMATGAPVAERTPVAWLPQAELEFDEWLRQGSRLGMTSRGAGWWIGDWLRYGTARYGNKYAAACRVTGYDRQTLMNMVYVANRFEPSRRRENLSWSHHAELAGFDPGVQERWLTRASTERFSVRDLREALQARKRPVASDQPQATEAPDWQAGESPNAEAGTSALHQHGATRARRKTGRPSSRAGDREHQVVCPCCGHTFIA